MKKIALIIPHCDDGWVGGLNYYCNLISQCHNYAKDSIDISVIINAECVDKIRQIIPHDITVLSTPLVKKYTLTWLMRHFICVITRRDFLMERFLIQNNFELLTHSACRNYGKKIKTIGWIPDIQHKYLPHLFSHKEINKRDREFQTILDRCDRIILSSQVAFDDVLRFYKVSQSKLAVLHFYKQADNLTTHITKEALRKKYDLPDCFFFLPNQFWVHKNHSIVIEALRILKSKNKHIVVVCSGSSKDYRNPNYFKQLMNQVTDLELQDHFKVLGLIPMTEVNALIYHAIALINPSLFEGWSTTVEEARAYGKRIILSTIPVHQEQSPPDALFFKLDSADELADCLQSTVVDFNRENEKFRKENAQINALKLCTDFAHQYVKIVNSTSMY